MYAASSTLFILVKKGPLLLQAETTVAKLARSRYFMASILTHESQELEESEESEESKHGDKLAEVTQFSALSKTEIPKRSCLSQLDRALAS